MALDSDAWMRQLRARLRGWWATLQGAGAIAQGERSVAAGAGGVAAGGDVILEHGGAGLYQPIDLGIARCRLVVAARRGYDYGAAVQQGARLRIATKYVNLTREHFAGKGVHVDLIRLYGSMELAPLLGLADAIVDLVSSGKTLRANNLVAVEEIRPISARLVVNQVALKTRRPEMQPLIGAFSRAVQGRAGTSTARR